MDVIKKWVGWILALALVLFLIAMYQKGNLDFIVDKVKVPSVDINTK